MKIQKKNAEKLHFLRSLEQQQQKIVGLNIGTKIFMLANMLNNRCCMPWSLQRSHKIPFDKGMNATNQSLYIDNSHIKHQNQK